MLRQQTVMKTTHEWIGILETAGVPCGPINNIEQVRRALEPLPDCLRYEAEVKRAEGAAGGEAVSRVLASLYEVVSTANSLIVDKIKQVVDRVADRASIESWIDRRGRGR